MRRITDLFLFFYAVIYFFKIANYGYKGRG